MSRFLAPLPLLLLAAAGCTQRIQAPTASIGLLNTRPIYPGIEADLDGQGSSDPNSQDYALTYSWRMISAPPGSTAALNATDLPVVSFVPDQYGDYTVGLSVSNGVLWSAEATQMVTADSCGNEPPAVSAMQADPASPMTGQVVQLSATPTDPDIDGCGQDPTMSWAWSLGAVPAGSAARLNDPSAQDPSFTADVPGDYEVDLVLTDVTGRSSAMSAMTVTVSDCGNAAPVVDSVDVSPATPHTGDAVSLAVSVSDADNDSCGLSQVLDVTSALVSLPAGSHATLSPSAGTTPAFVADVPGDYVVRTTVTDGTGRSGSTETTVSVDQCGEAAPSVSLQAMTVDGASVTVPYSGTLYTGQTVGLTWSATDSDNTDCGMSQSLVVTSALLQAPSGSMATLSPTTGPTTGLSFDMAGTYVVRATVTDSTGRSGYFDVTLVPDASCLEALARVVSPEPSGWSNSVSIHEDPGVPVLLSAAMSSESCSNATLSYAWRFVAVPAGSQVRFNDPTLEQPSFDSDVPGEYQVDLAVSDGIDTSHASLHIFVDPALLLHSASGYSVQFLAGGTDQWDRPLGLTEDASSPPNIYVVQNGGGRVTVTTHDGSATSTVSVGGYLQSPQDIVYDSTDDDFLVTAQGAQDIVLTLQADGQQGVFTTDNLFLPTGIAFDSSTGRVAVANRGSFDSSGQVRWYDVTNAASNGLVDFHGAPIDRPFGVWESGNVYWAVNTSGVQQLVRSDGYTLSSVFTSPLDLARVPSGDLVVTDPGSGAVFTVPNCTPVPAGNCQATLVAWGPWEPAGVWPESDTSILVTDRAGNGLYRITTTGSF